MTALAHDDQVAWYWLPTVASVAAPTVANIAAGTRLTGVVGYDTPASESEVDVSDIDSLYDTSVVGTTKVGPIVLTFKHDDTADTMWELLDTPRLSGFLLKSIEGIVIATTKVQVYPVQMGQRRDEGYARNTVQRFMVSFYVTSEPNLDAVIAA
jgi:hypothetical protein